MKAIFIPMDLMDFSTCDTSVQSGDTTISSRVPNWVSDSIGWLKEVFGDFGNGGMTKPYARRM